MRARRFTLSVLGALGAVLAAGCGGAESAWTRTPGMTTLFASVRGALAPVPVFLVIRVDGGNTFKVGNLSMGVQSMVGLGVGPHTVSIDVVTQVADPRGGLRTPRVFRATQAFDLTSTSALLRIELVANGSASGYEIRYGGEQTRLGRSALPVEVSWIDPSIQALDELLETARGRGELDRAGCILGHRNVGLDAKLSSDQTPAAVRLSREAVSKALADARACANPLPRDDSLRVDPCAASPSPCAPLERTIQ